jgi:hypothetical protein
LPHCSVPGSVDDVVDEELEVGVEVDVELEVLVVSVDEVTVVLPGSEVLDELLVVVVEASVVVDVVSVVLVVVGRTVVVVVSMVLVVGRMVVEVVSVVLVVVSRTVVDVVSVVLVVGSNVVEVDDVGSTVVVVVTTPAWASDPSDASHTKARSDASMLRRHDGQARQTRSSKGRAAIPPPTSGGVRSAGESA